MMFHRLELINKNQRGFGLLEVILTIAITGIIAGGVTMTFFQMVDGSARAANHLTAVNQVQSAGHWVSRDAQMAKSVELKWGGEHPVGSRFPLRLTWTDGDGNEHEVIYTLEPQGEPKKFKRSYSINGGEPSEAIVAQHIVPGLAKTHLKFIDTNEDGIEDTLIFTVTASVGEGSREQRETRVYEVSPRPQESPQQCQLLTNDEQATHYSICTTRWGAQTFTSGVTAELTEVTLRLRLGYIFEDPVEVILEITECDADGKPLRTPGEPDDKSDVLGTALFELPPSGEWEICTFENFTDAEGGPVAVSLTKGTKYAIVAYTFESFPSPPGRVPQWHIGPFEDTYEGGDMFLWRSDWPKEWVLYVVVEPVDFYFNTFAGEKYTISAWSQEQ